MKEKAAYLKGLIDGLGIDENTKEGKVIKAMRELLSEMAETVDSIDEDVTHAYDQINDLSEELEDLEADLYEDEDAEDEEDDSDDKAEADDDDDNADVAGEPYYEVACPACGKTVYVSEDDLAGERIVGKLHGAPGHRVEYARQLLYDSGVGLVRQGGTQVIDRHLTELAL